MKKIFLLFAALAVCVSSFAAPLLETPPRKASEIFVPVGKNGEKISVLDLSRISVKDFEAVSGRNLKLMDKISFKLAQRELKKSISADGTINKKKLAKVFDKMADGETGFHIGGFALGFLLGLIGVLIAYLINDEKKRNRVKWAWIGLAAAVVLYILLLI